jgi:UDP-glucose 4-epimerase
MANYLVTGGCGFIGSNLVDELIGAGHNVKVVDDLSTGRRENLHPKADLIVGDICDPNIIKPALQDTDGCFHLAAIASVERSIHDWVETHRVNLTGTISVFDAAKDVKRGSSVPVVYASSAAIYGDNASMPLTEREIPRPLTAYGADKLACELHARVGSLVHDVRSTGLRFFNVYGPRQDPSSPYSGVISIFLDRLIQGNNIKVFGDGGQCRDFVYVGDVVRFLIAGMNRTSGQHEIVNVCTGRMVTLNQLAQTISSLTGQPLQIERHPPRNGDIRVSLGDPERARRILGIEAEVELSEGLKRTIQSLFNPAEAA